MYYNQESDSDMRRQGMSYIQGIVDGRSCDRKQKVDRELEGRIADMCVNLSVYMYIM
jgi:hypothetical protein